MRLWALVVNTFKETLRNRILLNILIFAMGLILLSLAIGDWSLGQQAKVIKDFGLSAMSVFGLLIALFIGLRLLVQELEQQTIHIIASKPVHRWEIILGKFLGMAMTLAVNVALMTAALWLAGLLIEGSIDLALLPAIVLIYLEILIMVAFSMLYASFASPILAAVFTLGTFAVGHLSGFLYDYVRLYPDTGLHWLLRTIYTVAPNLEKLNLKMAVVQGLSRPPHQFVYAVVYGLAYLSIVLLVTALSFERRDLK